MDFQNIAITIVTSGVVSSLATLGVQTYLKQGITHYFNKELALFNAEITIQAENRKLDFDRKVHDFSIYSKKRHEVYPELYKQIYAKSHQLRHLNKVTFLSKGNIDSRDKVIPYLKGMVEGRNLNSFFKILGKIASTEKFINYVNGISDEVELEEFVERVNDNIKILYRIEIAGELLTLEAFFQENILYISDSVFDILSKIVSDLYFLATTGKSTSNEMEKFKEVESNIEELRKILKKELSVGDYS